MVGGPASIDQIRSVNQCANDIRQMTRHHGGWLGGRSGGILRHGTWPFHGGVATISQVQVSRFLQAWFPAATRGQDGATASVYRDRPGLWLRNVAISLLLPIALLALCLGRAARTPAR